MTAAQITRRGLMGAGAATLGAAALPALAPVPAAAETPSTVAAGAAALDAALFDLLSRRGDALAVAKAAGVELDAAAEVTGAAWDAKPSALWRGPRDHHLGIGPCSSIPGGDGAPRRFYTIEDLEEVRRGMDKLRGLDLTPYEAEMAARYREIIEAHATWSAQVDEAQAATGYDALSDRFDEAWDAVIAIEREIVATPVRTLTGLCAKAAMLADRADRRTVDHVPVDFAREVAAFAQASA